jgi:hypothetical protein
MGLFDEKTRDLKSRDTVPLKMQPLHIDPNQSFTRFLKVLIFKDGVFLGVWREEKKYGER